MSAGLGSRRCSGRSDPKSSSLPRSASNVFTFHVIRPADKHRAT
jgi:hypothetical protein